MLKIVIILFSTFTIACSTVRVRVAVIRPAEINLHGKNEIVVDEITGPSADPIATQIKEAVASSPYVKLIAPQSDAGTTRLKGHVKTQHVDEKTWNSEDYCDPSAQRSNKQRCVFHYREAIAKSELCFDLFDMGTNTRIFNKEIACTQKEKTQYTQYKNEFFVFAFFELLADIFRSANGTFNRAPSINHESVLRRCDKDLAIQVLHTISSWEEMVTVQLQKDSQLPKLKEGIAFVKAGDWGKATQLFLEAQKEAENMPSLPKKTMSKVYWDLGMAYLYNARFDDAHTFINRAYTLTANRTYKKELSNVERMKQDHTKFIEQTGESTPGPSHLNF